MARQARIVLPGVAHHVTQRGNNRQDIFFVEEDYREYLSHLRESIRRYELNITAYCLMTNHIHLIATPTHEESLAKALGRAHLMYAQYIHKRYGHVGHFWQNRFYSCPMDDTHASNAAAYIELNPVRAGLVAQAWEYPWSSAAAHCTPAGDTARLLTPDTWFREIPMAEWKNILTAISDSDSTAESLHHHTRTGHPLGDEVFLSQFEAAPGQATHMTSRGRPKGSKDKKKRKHLSDFAQPLEKGQ